MVNSNFTVKSEKNIPPLPSTVARVLKFDIENPDHGIEEMEMIIKPDRGLCTELLKISNSSLYGRSGSVKTLRGAITLLGVKAVKNIGFMLHIQKINSLLRGRVYKKYIHEYGILTALIAFDLCTPFNRRSLKEDLFLSGLLYRIGMTIFALEDPGKYMQILGQSERGDADILQLEQEEYGTDQFKLGVSVFRLWDMPSDLIEVVEKFDFSREEIPGLNDRVRLTALADSIAARLLGIFPGSAKEERLNDIIGFYGIEKEKIAVFNEEYLKLMQSHPLFLMAVP